MVIEGVARGLVWKNNDKAAHVECRCSHTEALRVNPRLPIGGSGLCTPSSSRSLTAVVIEGVGGGPVWKNSHDECRCSHTEALRVNPRLPIGSSGLCTPSSSRSLNAVVFEGVGGGPIWKNNDETHTTSAGVHTQKRFGSTRTFQSVVPVYVRPLAAGA